MANPPAQGHAPFSLERPAENLPQTTTANLFQVTGGEVALIGIIGKITTVVQAAAVNFRYLYYSGTGSASQLHGNLDLNAWAVGRMWGCDGTGGAAAPDNAIPVLFDKPIPITSGGYIQGVTDASRTGQYKSQLLWLPITAGARIILV